MPDRIVTPFTAASTAADVVDGVDLTGRRAIVTGGASGIGIETGRALAGAGAEVTLAVRDAAGGARVAADIIATTGNKGVHVDHLDLRGLAEAASNVPGTRTGVAAHALDPEAATCLWDVSVRTLNPR